MAILPNLNTLVKPFFQVFGILGVTMTSTLPVSIIQTPVTDAKNEILSAIKIGSKLICLPELFCQNPPEEIPGPLTQSLHTIAQDHNVHILAGSINEKSHIKAKPYNTSTLIHPDGHITTYRKIHLFKLDNRIDESAKFTAGSTPSTAQIGPFKAGLSICYDIRFPTLYQHYYREGCNLILIPSAFTHETGLAHWETLCRARAIETQSYVIAPNQVGTGPHGQRLWGNSLIIDPWGTIIARGIATNTQIISATLDITHVHSIRQKLPLSSRL